MNIQSDHINNLYLDSNSIIYDVARTISYKNDIQFEDELLAAICKKIQYYIQIISPNEKVLIAFDGVAPVAKLEQQRNRRYKSWFQQQVSEEIYEETEKKWDTIAITPGTNFMKKLSTHVQAYFRYASKFGVKEIIISCSDLAGEGEHKIFQYIRDHPETHEHSMTAIYGLDADLIMLTMNHLRISKNLYLFRETPHFIKNIDRSLSPNETYLMHITEFSEAIIEELSNFKNITPKKRECMCFDYILLCFFLGNDFLPHFPALNIRTNGIDYLMGAYKTVIGPSEYLTDGKVINWKYVLKLIQYLAKNELGYLLDEYKKRDKCESRCFPNKTAKECDDKFQQYPIQNRVIEKYINPTEPGWQSRYYNKLFDIDITDLRRKQISINYLEGLEWTIKYYTSGCADWRWCYKYDYPPLLSDLVKYVPYFDTEFIKHKDANPVTQLVQLSYVLPRNSLKLLPELLWKKLIHERSEWYRLDYGFRWSFCKYFWEAHVVMPEIDISELEIMVGL